MQNRLLENGQFSLGATVPGGLLSVPTVANKACTLIMFKS